MARRIKTDEKELEEELTKLKPIIEISSTDVDES